MSKTEKAHQLAMNMSGKAHMLLDYITKHGGTVELNNRKFNEFVHVLWDIWEDGYRQGHQKEKNNG